MSKLSFMAGAVCALALGLAGTANAAVVDFSSGPPATSWADGTFTTNLSGIFPDGFFMLGGNPASAYNGYGQDNEKIIFNNAVTLNSLLLGKCNVCFDATPSFFTVNLYNSASNLIGAGSVTATPGLQLLTFNISGVKSIAFTFSGQSGNPYNGDTRSVAWYNVQDVTYNPVPEPGVWALMISGFGMAGAMIRRRKALAA